MQPPTPLKIIVPEEFCMYCHAIQAVYFQAVLIQNNILETLH